jgi:acetyltransferase-like isoleucine patch superfamily enzyme
MIWHLTELITEKIKNIMRQLITKHRYPHVEFGFNTHVGEPACFGTDVKVYEDCTLADIDVQSYTYIGGNSKIAHCRIGKFCSIAPEVRIGLGVHPTHGISVYPGFYSKHASGARHPITRIGNDVWIGTRAIIPGGITIGDGAIIGAGSVVTKDVSPYSIVGGIPAKLIRKRFSDGEVETLLDFKWWDKDENFLREEGPNFMNPELFFNSIARRQ